MKTTIVHFSLITLLSLCFWACGPDLPPEVEQEMATLPKRLDYNFHIKPILSDRCFTCHGPDAQHQEAGLRLDSYEHASAALESGNGHAIIPGKPGKSTLVHRILAEDPEIQMPPAESNLSLSNREKAILTRWIREGAEYKPHWAFIKPERPKTPTIKQSEWPRNPIDHFILSRLEQESIQPSEEADSLILLRRLFFDLTGLPPMAADIDRYTKDIRPDKYEKLVDSLLNLPAYGERMAAYWMDVARFSDSEGYLDDYHHAMWPYRDWVIEAFNKNLPYNDFILWQVGGDQMPDGGTEQTLATAFNRLHKHNSEGGIIPEEFRVEYNVDRTHTLGTAFMGLTMGCARCHDHKYDPISQKNFYEIYAFFNSTIERGDAVFAANALEQSKPIPNYYAMNSGPVLPLPSEEVAAIRSFLQKEITSKMDSLADLTQQRRANFEEWKNKDFPSHDFTAVIREKKLVHLPFDAMQNGVTQNLANPQHPGKASGLKLVPGKYGQSIESDAAGRFQCAGLDLDFEHTEPFAISFWIYTPKTFEDSHVFWNGNRRIQGYRGWDVLIEEGKLAFRISHAHPFQSLHRRTLERLPLNTWTHFTWTYDGSSRAEGIQLYLNGVATDSKIVRNFIYRSAKPYKKTEHMVYGAYDQLCIGNRHYDQDFTGGRLDELKVYKGYLSPLEALFTYDEEAALNLFQSDENEEALFSYYQQNIDTKLRQERFELKKLKDRELVTIDTVREIMVMGDWDEERPTYILDRGLYDAPTDQVKRNVPEDILPFPDDLPKNRYGLGQWLIHEDHPLTSRVAVNQFWYLMFGRGIVETNEDFGNQGALPTHPDLLDWLAVDFRESAWDVKRLIRMMVTSSTYRQSSKVRPELKDIDPENRLLARSPRYRRSTEMIRDNALAVSGLLKKEVGGRSAFPYQPEGLWGDITKKPFFIPYTIDPDNGIHRRSLYTFWKRNLPPPAMLVFDAPIRAECTMRRQQSNTPLQALIMLNDPQIIEACRVLAEQIWHNTEEENKALAMTFEALIGRPATEKETAILKEYYSKEYQRFRDAEEDALAFLSTGFVERDPVLPPLKVAALARVANTIMNSTEGYYKN